LAVRLIRQARSARSAGLEVGHGHEDPRGGSVDHHCASELTDLRNRYLASIPLDLNSHEPIHWCVQDDIDSIVAMRSRLWAGESLSKRTIRVRGAELGFRLHATRQRSGPTCRGGRVSAPSQLSQLLGSASPAAPAAGSATAKWWRGPSPWDVRQTPVPLYFGRCGRRIGCRPAPARS
jgi:hypothetical protein